MDTEDFITTLCNELARGKKQLRNMHAYYIWIDKRPGTVEERFRQDAEKYAEYVRLKQP